MVAGAGCIDDIDVLRSGGMKTLFDGVYAPSTAGTLLREFTFGHEAWTPVSYPLLTMDEMRASSA